MRISAIGIFDDYVHTMMDSYSKMLSQVNSAIDKKTSKVGKKTHNETT